MSTFHNLHFVQGNNEYDYYPQVDDTLSVEGKAADARATGKINNKLNHFVSLSDLLVGATFEQGAIVSMNKWSDYTVNTTNTRIHAFVDVNLVKDISIYVTDDYQYEVAFFDNGGGLIAHLSAWRSDSRSLTLTVPASYMRINVRNGANTALTTNEGIEVYEGGYPIEKMYAGLYPKLAIGIVNDTSAGGNKPVLTFDTTAKTVAVSNCYIIDGSGERYVVTAQTVSYTAGSSVGTQTLVYDTTDGVVKPKYTKPSVNTVDNSTQVVLAFYHNTRVQNGTICTNLTFNIDDKYFGNFPKTLGAVEEGQLVKLKVCSYNLGVFNYGVSGTTISEEDEAIIISECRNFFSTQSCDILGLQENRQTLNTKSVNSEIYDYLYPYSFGYYNTTWLKSRYPLIASQQSTFESSGRPYVYGTLDVNGLNIFVICVHFALTSELRAQEYAELIAILAQHEYFICFGDFNANNDGTTNPQDEFNTLINEGYRAANGGYLGLMVTHPQDNKKLDNIFVSSNITIANSFVPDVYANMHSDHLPVIAELVICS